MGRMRIILVIGCALWIAANAVVPTLGQVVINEIAWGGTAASAQDEWIELHNSSDAAVNLTGWTVKLGDRVIELGPADEDGAATNAIIPAGGYFLLERTDDTTISSLAADLIYVGSLPNSGADLALIDAEGRVVDACSFAGEGWAAGGGSDDDPPYASMERVIAGAQPAVWATCEKASSDALDANGSGVFGTPGALNYATHCYLHAPRVVVTAEYGATVSSPVTVTWSAADPDGEAGALAISLEVSVDEGETWHPVASGLTNGGAYVWDGEGAASGDSCILRIVAEDSDGFTGRATSGEFVLEK